MSGSNIRNRIEPGLFLLVVNDIGEWRIYRAGGNQDISNHLISVDLTYRGPGTTEWSLHYGRAREPFQGVLISMIRGIYETAEDAIALTPTLESGRLALEDARDRFRVLLALLGNVSPH